MPSALTFSMVSMDWSSILDKHLHDTMQTQSNLRDILQGYGSLQGYGRSQAAHQQRTDGAAENILQRRQGSQRTSQREVKKKATRRTTGANKTHNNITQQNADGHPGFVATSPYQCGRNVSRRTLWFGGIGGQRSTRRKPDSSVRYTDVCSRTAKHQRNMYAGAWQSTSGIFEQLINVSSLGLMLIH